LLDQIFRSSNPLISWLRQLDAQRRRVSARLQPAFGGDGIERSSTSKYTLSQMSEHGSALAGVPISSLFIKTSYTSRKLQIKASGRSEDRDSGERHTRQPRQCHRFGLFTQGEQP
jgi:hypothetical protein